MKILDRIEKLIMRILEVILIILVFTMAVVITMQVVVRLIGTPLLWSEEASRIMMVWLVFLGAAYLFNVAQNGHIIVDVIHQIVPAPVQKALLAVVSVIVFAILIVTTIYGYQLAAKSGSLLSTALDVPFSCIYSAIPVSTAIMLFFSLRKLIGWGFGKQKNDENITGNSI